MNVTKVTGLTFFLILIVSANVYAQTHDEFHLDETYDIGTNGNIELNTDDAEIKITAGDYERVRLKVDYVLKVSGLKFGKQEKFDMRVEARSNKLTIKEKDRNFSVKGIVTSMKETYTVQLAIPAGTSLDIKGDDDTYTIENLAGNLKMEVDDSEIRIIGSRTGLTEISMDDGDLKIDQGQGRMRLDMDDTRAEIMNGDFQELDFDVDDAEIILQTQLADDGRYQVEMDDGFLEFVVTSGGGEFRIRHDDPDISAGSNFRQQFQSENESSYRLPGGNARIHIRSDDGTIRLETL